MWRLAFACVVFASLEFVFSASQQGNALPAIQCYQKEMKNIKDEEVELVKSVQMVMTRNERILLLREMKKAKIYAEWGCGGSTELACKLPHLEKIITIESSQEFMNGLINNSTCLKGNAKIVPIYVNIGPTGTWGVPQDKKSSDKWPSYPDAIMQVTESSKPDFFLIDGRFRIACALRLLLTYRNNPKGLTFAIHDFFWRNVYHSILHFTEIADCMDSLVILKPKEGINYQLVEEDFQKYTRKWD
jgi:hypothetical protein